METGILKVVMFIVNSFLPYLWGMETKPKPGQWTCLSCSYRTYEEWKLNYIFSHLWDDLVLTVPMRNGNSILSILLIFIKPVLTVPMRNGNLDFLSSMFHTTQVLTVPMRNGNQGLWHGIAPHPETCSYRTYEEWKRTNNKVSSFYESRFLPYLWGMETPLGANKPNCKARSYRTYEEWKPYCNHAYYLMTYHRSYRTYEEWKLRFIPTSDVCPIKFLPYLWGMETTPSAEGQRLHFFRSYRTYEEWKPTSSELVSKEAVVLTVPMRNGNV